jgi:outer membrane protein TolC
MQQVLCAMALGLAGLAVAGCATYTRVPLDPHRELAALRDRSLDGFAVEHAVPGQEDRAAQVAFEPSDGFSEAEVVAVGLTLNPDLRAKRLEMGEARSLLIAAGIWPNPEVGLAWLGGIAGASGSVVEADVLFELLRLGERSARKEAARARMEEVGADVIAQEYRTVAEVRSHRWAVLAAYQSVRLLEEEASLRERASDLVRQRRQVGEGTELDISVSELELAETRRDLRQAQGELEAQQRLLNRLLGLPPDYALRLSEAGQPLTITVFEDLADEELDRRLLQGRFDLRASEAAYARAEEELKAAILRQYPRLRLGPAFQRELEGDASLGLGLSLELPLFDRNQGEIAERQAARDRLRAEYQALLHRIRADAYAARAVLRRARLEVETQERDILPLIRRNQTLFEGAFRARELNIVDWVTAQQRAVRARREYLESLVRYGEALVQLEAATGMPLSRPTTMPTTQPVHE